MSTDFVLFGASGDLASRKIFPALFDAFCANELGDFNIIATGRSNFNNASFLDFLEQKSAIHIKNLDHSKWANFCALINYVEADVKNAGDFEKLKALLRGGNVIYYLSVAPQFFINICENLAICGMNSKDPKNNKNVKIVLEKPLGSDLASSLEINNTICRFFNEDQIFRIDHYLGKQSVQNILRLRALNPMLEALLNKDFVSNVQISVCETLGIEERGGFYDATGAMRDMLQNHMMQIASLFMMDLPSDGKIREGKIKLLSEIKKLDIKNINDYAVYAQYSANNGLSGYLDEKNVAPNSRTETFVALKLLINNARYDGVILYLRHGKRMDSKFAKIVVVLKNNAHITLNLQPQNTLSFSLNIPSKSGFKTQELRSDLELENALDPYHKLLVDVVRGDATYFAHNDELTKSWEILDPLLLAQKNETLKLCHYPAQTSGPQEMHNLLARDGDYWI